VGEVVLALSFAKSDILAQTIYVQLFVSNAESPQGSQQSYAPQISLAIFSKKNENLYVVSKTITQGGLYMFVSSIGQRVLPAISRQLAQPLKHIPKKQPSLLIRHTHSEHNKVALATQEQLHKVQLGLNDKISGVENKLTEKIAGVETRLSEKISALDTKFTKEIAGVETRLTEKFTKEIAGVETRLTEKIANVLTAMEKQNTALLTAVEKQNTGNERFKKRVYTMLGGFAATFIGYANRDRLFTMLASLKP
jgi:hypothetical protein